MPRNPAQIGIVLLLAVQPLIKTAAADDGPLKDTPLGIGIMVMDHGRLGSCHLEQVKAAAPSATPLPHFYYVHYVWDGTHLRIRPGQYDEREWSKEIIAKDGWYVTADYSTKPPRVILTKEPTEDSRWRFVEASSSHYFIKNENSGWKNAWLNLKEDTTKRYSSVDKGLSDARGNSRNRYWEGSVYEAVLSPDEKAEFFVNDIKGDGGK
jgi:hypothetical protein